MVDVTEEELTIIENVLVTMRENVDTTTPEWQDMAQKIVEAEQIVSSKLDGSGSQQAAVGTDTSPSGPGV